MFRYMFKNGLGFQNNLEFHVVKPTKPNDYFALFVYDRLKPENEQPMYKITNQEIKDLINVLSGILPKESGREYE